MNSKDGSFVLVSPRYHEITIIQFSQEMEQRRIIRKYYHSYFGLMKIDDNMVFIEFDYLTGYA